MPRNTAKKAYFSVGISYDSDTYRKLLEDALNRDMTPAKLIPVRLADYYAGIAPSHPHQSPVVQEHSQNQNQKSNAEAAAMAWGDD